VDIKSTVFPLDTIQVDNNYSADSGGSGFDRYMDTAFCGDLFYNVQTKTQRR